MTLRLQDRVMSRYNFPLGISLTLKTNHHHYRHHQQQQPAIKAFGHLLTRSGPNPPKISLTAVSGFLIHAVCNF
jgi:hypothetical protein